MSTEFVFFPGHLAASFILRLIFSFSALGLAALAVVFLVSVYHPYRVEAV